MKKIAVIGAGIAGLVSARNLSRHHNVTLFEKNDYIGGHTHTVDVHVAGRDYAVDTGFIVFNDRTYPNFIALLNELNVAYKPTEMSFSVNNRVNGLEYNGHTLATLFAQRRNIFSPQFYRFLFEILRFNRLAKAHADTELSELSLGAFLKLHGFTQYFQQNYLLPMGAAIWSTSIAGMRAFPLEFFLRFFLNHGLLDVNNRPQWYVINGGSRSYIEPLLTQFTGEVVTGANIEKVVRNTDGVSLRFTDGHQQQFDEVVFACHSNEALALLDSPSETEQELLTDLSYADNEVVLHTDTSLLPKRRKAWASWNYLIDNLDADSALPQLTYNMNILQGIDSSTTFCVTLNATSKIDEEKVLRRFIYAHPQYTVAAAKAQQRWQEISGQQRTHFCGAYWFNGFHEDGVKSALRVVEQIGQNL